MTNHRECRKGVVILLTFMLSWSTVVTQSHFKPCPDQWTHYRASCYQLISRAAILQEATEACRLHQAHLVFIEGHKELDFVTGFLDEDSSPIWLGARYDRRRQKWMWSGDTEDNRTDVQFSQWSYGVSAPGGGQYCSAVGKNGWWNFVSCSGTLPFLCEKSRPCEAGWYGGDCDAQCHCLSSDPCNKEDGVCPRGCSPGWSGACTKANPLPDASFHCLRTVGGDLRADLMVDVRGRRYSVIQAVSQEGEPLSSCSLLGIRQHAHQIFIPLLLPGAFAEDDVNGTDSSGNNVTDVEVTSEASAPSSSNPEVTAAAAVSESRQSSTLQSTHASTVVGSGDTTSSAGPVGSAAPAVTTVEGGEGGGDESVSSAADGGDDDDNSTVAVTASYGDEATEGNKRAVSSGNRIVVKAHSEEACVASQSENGSVTWLIEFKEFPEVLTGNDVTVEVTCDLDEADSLESVDFVADDSEKGVPMEASRMPVTMSVYLTDHHTGQPADHFHLGQRLMLHVDVQGLSEHECAFPHSCVVKAQGAQGQEVQILDEHGCGTPKSPVGQLQAKRTKGQFISAAFPAFSLGSSAVELECQVHVEPTADARQCQTSCRGA